MPIFSLQLLAFKEVPLKFAEFLFLRNKPRNSDVGIFGQLSRHPMCGVHHTGPCYGDGYLTGITPASSLMIIDHTHRLQKGIDDDRTHEFHPPAL